MLSGLPHLVWFTKDGFTSKENPHQKREDFTRQSIISQSKSGLRTNPKKSVKKVYTKRITYSYYAIIGIGTN